MFGHTCSPANKGPLSPRKRATAAKIRALASLPCAQTGFDAVRCLYSNHDLTHFHFYKSWTTVKLQHYNIFYTYIFGNRVIFEAIHNYFFLCIKIINICRSLKFGVDKKHIFSIQYNYKIFLTLSTKYKRISLTYPSAAPRLSNLHCQS